MYSANSVCMFEEKPCKELICAVSSDLACPTECSIFSCNESLWRLENKIDAIVKVACAVKHKHISMLEWILKTEVLCNSSDIRSYLTFWKVSVSEVNGYTGMGDTILPCLNPSFLPILEQILHFNPFMSSILKKTNKKTDIQCKPKSNTTQCTVCSGLEMFAFNEDTRKKMEWWICQEFKAKSSLGINP